MSRSSLQASVLWGAGLVIGGLLQISGALAASPTFLNPNYTFSDFATINVNTRSLVFDNFLNLYVEDVSDDGSGTVNISVLTPASSYTSSSLFASYTTTANRVTGLSFDPAGTLYAAETNSDGDSGLIRNVTGGSVVVTDLPNFRPTGVFAAGGNVFYLGGRQNSDPTFGSIFRLPGTTTPEVVIPGIVPTGVALDASGNIYVSTRQNDFGGFNGRSIYRFDAASSFSSGLLVAQFDNTLGIDELTFDRFGNLYALFQNSDNLSSTPSTIIKLSAVTAPVPEPEIYAMMGIGLGVLGWLGRRRKSGVGVHPVPWTVSRQGT